MKKEEGMMKIEFDRKADSIYIYFAKKPIAYTKKLDDMRYIDYSEDDSPIGVELLCVKDGVVIDNLPNRAEIERYLGDKGIRIFA